MKSKGGYENIRSFLGMVEKQVHENEHIFLIVGKRVISYFVPNIILFQCQLQNESHAFSIRIVKGYCLFKEDLSKSCYLVFTKLDMKKGKSLERLKKTIQIAEKANLVIFEKYPANA